MKYQILQVLFFSEFTQASLIYEIQHHKHFNEQKKKTTQKAKSYRKNKTD